MPEGDSVFVLARRLDRSLTGTTVVRSDLRVPRLATRDLAGRRVLEHATHGKHLLTRFSGEAAPRLGADPRVPLVSALLDQTRIAGLGNLWVKELCFLVGRRPWTPVGRAGPACAAGRGSRWSPSCRTTRRTGVRGGARTASRAPAPRRGCPPGEGPDVPEPSPSGPRRSRGPRREGANV